MNLLIVINDAPYGTEKAYNALRLAMTSQREHPDVQVKIFLMADAVGAGLPNQQTPEGYYNIERMLKSVLAKGAEVKACIGCAHARGMAKLSFIEGIQISDMKAFTQWTMDSDKIMSF